MKLLVIGSKARVEKYLPDLPITREVETVVVERGASDDEILDAASDADFIMADAISPVSARLIESMPNLRLIHSEGVAPSTWTPRAPGVSSSATTPVRTPSASRSRPSCSCSPACAMRLTLMRRCATGARSRPRSA